jgi:hypothetical protein
MSKDTLVDKSGAFEGGLPSVRAPDESGSVP